MKLSHSDLPFALLITLIYSKQIFEECLKQWQHRNLALMGKVIKKYALPKFIYALSSLPNPLDQTVKELKNLSMNSYGMVNLK